MTIKAKYMVCGKQTYEGTMEVPNDYFDMNTDLLVVGEPPVWDEILMVLLNKLSVSRQEVSYWHIYPI